MVFWVGITTVKLYNTYTITNDDDLVTFVILYYYYFYYHHRLPTKL